VSSTPTSDGNPVLDVAAVSGGYGRRLVLERVSLVVGAGEAVALIGLNGAGKSTLLRTIMGYLRPVAGRIVFGGADLRGREPFEITRRGIAYVPQDQPIFPDLSVAEHLNLGAWTVSRDARASAEARVFRLFPRLRQRLGQRASTLSGGERQMLAMGRALMTNPVLLLLDEPSLGLAPMVVTQMFGALDAINRAGTAILIVEQNASKALAHSSRAYVLESGRITLEGPSATLASRPDIRSAYLGGEA
jgi:branched-chain amino acid transport system ATP-binding protein